MLAINQTLQGRYKIVRLLGHGGMGAVYEAIDKRFGEPIALKEIIIDSSNEKQGEMVRSAFEREAKSLAKARHEVVPYVRDYFSELDRQFLVMELVEGDDLGDLLEKRKTPFPVEDVINWLEQLLDALDYLHNLTPPIIHRDIKPQNLKLNARQRLKLLDFGIARSTDKSKTVSKQTFVGATLNYSPIEQILRVIDQTFREFIILKHKDKAEALLQQDTDSRCDIYALGATFFHLLTNHPPIDATKRTLDIWEGKPDPLPNPSKLNPNIPLPISNCLLKAMEIERDKRFSSALEMEETLKLVIEQARTSSLELKIKTQADTLVYVSNPDLNKDYETEVLLNSPLSTFIPDDSKKSSSMVTEVLMTSPDLIIPNNQPVAETQLVINEPPKDDQTITGFAETQQNVNVPSSELTAVSYLDGVLIDQKNTSAVINSKTMPKEVETPSPTNNKLLWAIPITLVGFFGVTVIGLMFWFLRPSTNPAAANASTTNQTVSAPTAKPIQSNSPLANQTETPSDVSSATLEVTPTPSETPASSTSSSAKTAETKKTTTQQTEQPKPQPTAKIVDKPTPAPKPTTQANTPKPTPAKTQDPRCVFTNSCQ